ncbi:cadherin-like beta sandwich domain-containing protein [Paenibacillus sp. RS8]|uniref:cadherin-like beta sandwich domain-containing protein n=1 Tax=Paenibacillus sp. RS8 TaxID=3242681 RepID=UPI0035C18A01
MVLIILFLIGVLSGKYGAGIGGISAVAVAANISNQDGFGYSGYIPENEVLGTAFTGYQAWPSGFSKGLSAFVGGVYDGTSIWMIPYNADRLMKVNPSTGEMTGYSNWPAGFSKGSNAFAGGVYDGTNIWLIPYSADRVIKVNATTGVMTGYSSWPDGSRGSELYIGGTFDGTNIWLTPYSGSRLVKVDTTTGAMTSYNSWPSGTVLGSYPFQGSVFDGTSLWLIPSGVDRLIKVDPATGDMTGFNNWPSGFTKSANAFAGSVFDGINIWLIPNNATHLVKFNTTTGVMTGYNGWPGGFTKGSESFAGGVYDGTNIWLVPQSANMLMKVNAATGDMTGYNSWPSGFKKDNNAFMGGVYDGENVWMIPFVADRLMKFGDSTNADISSLMLSSGNLTPTFASGTTSYTASVANSVYSITVTPTLADAGASVKVNGTAVISGVASGAIPLAEGANSITIEATAADGKATKTYTVTLTREAPVLSTNADISSLTLSSGSLTPTFVSGTTSYTASVANSVSSITVTPTVAEAGASVKVNGTTVTSGAASDAIALIEGANPITIEVIAADGTSKTYTVIMTREAAVLSTNADISSLMLSSGSLTPTFASGTTSYTVSVANSVSSITVTPTVAEAGASVKVNGTTVTSGAASGAIPLAEGANPISIEVTAADGKATKTYTVTLTREAPVLSTNADISSLTLSSGNLTPTFASGTTSYTASVANSVSSITATPTLAEAGASVKVNGTAVTSGAASDAIALAEGVNPITIEVTAVDGKATKTYTVTLTREAAVISEGGSSSNTGNSGGKVTSTNGTLVVPVGSTGELSLPGEVTVVIPAGASDKELIITIERLTDTKDLLSDRQVLISPVYEILKNVTNNFTKSVTLTFVFDEAGLKKEQRPVVFYYDEVKKVWVQIDGGKADGNKITVGVDHFTKFAVMAVSKEKEQSGSDQLTFSDITGHWAASEIIKAAQSGIVNGYVNGMFKPNGVVTREEFVVMLMKALKPQIDAEKLKFTDSVKIGIWAQQAVEQAVQLGIVKGYSDGSFHPDAEITRTEMAVMIVKALALKVEDSAVTSFVDDARIPNWAKGQVAALKNLSLVSGKGNNEFAPNDKATRAEAVTILMKMIAQKSY